MATTLLAQVAEGGLWWRAQPKPRCSAFILTNGGPYVRVAGTASGSAFGDSVGRRKVTAAADYGIMFNISTHDAVGASFFASIETQSAAGLAVRYRRWLPSQTSLDVAVGVPLLMDGSIQSGLSGLVKFNLNHWFGVAL